MNIYMNYGQTNNKNIHLIYPKQILMLGKNTGVYIMQYVEENPESIQKNNCILYKKDQEFINISYSNKKKIDLIIQELYNCLPNKTDEEVSFIDSKELFNNNCIINCDDISLSDIKKVITRKQEKKDKEEIKGVSDGMEELLNDKKETSEHKIYEFTPIKEEKEKSEHKIYEFAPIKEEKKEIEHKIYEFAPIKEKDEDDDYDDIEVTEEDINELFEPEKEEVKERKIYEFAPIKEKDEDDDYDDIEVTEEDINELFEPEKEEVKEHKIYEFAPIKEKDEDNDYDDIEILDDPRLTKPEQGLTQAEKEKFALVFNEPSALTKTDTEIPVLAIVYSLAGITRMGLFSFEETEYKEDEKINSDITNVVLFKDVTALKLEKELDVTKEEFIKEIENRNSKYVISDEGKRYIVEYFIYHYDYINNFDVEDASIDIISDRCSKYTKEGNYVTLDNGFDCIFREIEE